MYNSLCYLLQADLNGDVLKEKYYPQQLHLVPNFNSDEWEFEVENVLKQRVNKKTGKKELLVRYLFYPGKKESLILFDAKKVFT